MNKQWKIGGNEDKTVISLIRNGRITKKTTFKELKKMNPEVFGEFTDHVVRNHLNTLKRARGLFCK